MGLTLNVGEKSVLGDGGEALTTPDYTQAQFINKVANIKRVSSDNQIAFAFGRSSAKNRITIDTDQCTDTIDCNQLFKNLF